MLRYCFYILLLVFAASFNSCSKETVKGDKSGKRISVALTPTIDCLPFYVAEQTGLARKMGYELCIQSHDSRSDCDTAIIYGSVDAIMTDSVRASQLEDVVKKIKSVSDSVVTVDTDSLKLACHDNIVLYFFTNNKSRLRKVSQLTDKMIALDRNGSEAKVGQYLLDSLKMIDKAFLIQMQNVRTRLEMLTLNSMDAVVLTEPQATVARVSKHNVIYTSANNQGKPHGCLLTSKCRDVFLNIYNAAVDTINKYGVHKYDSIIVSCMNVPSAVVKHMPDMKLKKIRE